MGVEIDLGCTSCSITYNYVHDCQGAAYGFGSASGSGTHVISNNIGVNCSTLASDTDGSSLNIYGTGTLQFCNNTIISYGSLPTFAIGTSANCANKTCLNNVFVAPAGVNTVTLPSSITGLVMDGNYHQSGDSLFSATFNGAQRTTLAAWKTATSLETSGVAAAHCYLVQPQPPPPLTPTTLSGASVYSPIAGSPLLNAGANMSGTYSITPLADFLGNSWTQNSIGAIYVAGIPNAYAVAVYADSPMSLWRLGDASGTTSNDTVGTFETLVLSNITVNQAVLNPVDAGPSISCNGTSSQATGVVTPHTYSLTAFTIEAWIKPAAVNLATGNTISESSSTVDGTPNCEIYLANTALAAVFRDASTGIVAATFPGVVLAANTVYHVVVTWTGTTLVGYVNGVSQTPTYTNQVALSSLTLSLPQIAVHNLTTKTRWFSGLIADVAWYPAVLSGARVLAHYNAGLIAINARRSLSDRVGSRGVA
jgi:hypothetical protein